MRNIDWDSVQEMQPGESIGQIPGGYPAFITRVVDKEDKQCLEIQWDYLNMPYAGANKETFERAGFWPTVLFRSYKDNALGYFKAFKTAVEESNPGYTFDCRNVQSLVGKKMGVVTGLEEYQKKNGEVGQRLYVYQTRSLQTIQNGDFEVPELKKLKPKKQAYSLPQNGYGAPPPYGSYPAASGYDFADISDDDKDFPF